MPKDQQPKFMKLWQGYTSGSFAGRDDGYPETKVMVFYDIRGLALDFGKRADERYFAISPMDMGELQGLVTAELAAIEQEKQDKQRAKDEAEFERLKAKLGKDE